MHTFFKKVKHASTLTLVLLALSVMPTYGDTYYVAKSGSDANACDSPEAPCLTIGQASRYATGPGDIVQVGPGNYSERIVITRGGDISAPIRYTGAGDGGCPTVENPDVNSRGLRPNPQATMQGFTVNASYVVVDCFRIVASKFNGEAGSGVLIGAKVQGVQVVDNFVDARETPGLPWAGVAMKSSIAPPNFAGDVTVARNYIVNTAFGLFAYCSQNCLFEENEVEELKPAPSFASDVDYSRIFGESVTMRRNYYHGNKAADCPTCHTDCFQSYNIGGIDNIARNITIDSNICFNAHQMVIVRDVTSKDPNSFVSHNNWTIVNNVFAFGPVGSRSTWTGLFDHVGNVKFEHNICAYAGVTAYLNGSNGSHNYNIHFETGWKSYSNSSPNWGNGSVTGRENLHWRSDGTFTASQWPNDIVNRRPIFIDLDSQNFRIDLSSPARNQAPSSRRKWDSLQVVRPQEGFSDIGAYEYRSPAYPAP